MGHSQRPFSGDAYDDLADLFLTESGAGANGAEEGDDAEPLPFLGQRDAGATGATTSAPTAGQTPGQTPGQTHPAAARSPHLMAILRVNLPVIAGPWLEQAAAVIAAQSGPVVLIRERGGKACLDLVSGRHGQDAAAAALREPADSLPVAFEQLRSVVGNWMIEVPPASDTPPDWLAVDEVILLTGADEAATVAAYAQAKIIANAAPALERISLVVVGSDDAIAHRSAERINLACRDSLGRDVVLRAAVRRMQPVPMRHLGRFAHSGDLCRTLRQTAQRTATPVAPALEEQVLHEPASMEARVLHELPASPRVALRPRVAPAPAAAMPHTNGLHPGHGESASPAAAPHAAAPAQSTSAARSVPLHDDARPAHFNGVAPAPPAAPPPASPTAPLVHPDPPRAAPPADGPAAPDTLLSLLDEVIALEIECPSAAGVEIGFDRHGRLHTAAEDDSPEALAQLFAATDWARQHASLLRRLNPFLATASAPGDIDVTAHLFTGRPRERRRLAEGSLRIHILVRDPAAGGRILTHLDLN